MNSNAARKRMMDEMLSVIAWLPPRHRHEAVLILFAAGLRRLSTAEIRAARVELIHGTPPCPCGCDNRTALTEILEGHLVLRELGYVGE